MKRKFSILLCITLAVVFVISNVAGVGAQGPDCSQGVCPEAANEESGVSSVETEGLGLTNMYTLRGGYVAAGTGLRNRGFGTITIKGIPRGATVYKAFLYWNILDYQQVNRHQRAIFQGQPIVGTYIGADREPCWIEDYGSSYSYRADVTPYVTGNKSYKLSGIASSRTNGADPFLTSSKAPLAEGASLVVIYTKRTLPLTKFFIWDGAATVITDTVSITIGPFAATDPVGPVLTTFIGADGQSGDDPFSQVNGFDVPQADWDGTDPQAGPNFLSGNLWDTDTARVGNYLRPGDTEATVSVKSSSDCLVWVAQVFSISSGAVDTDRDALLDGWEANGYDANDDFVVDVDLPAMGASPWHKDIFVEHDFMVGDHSHQPSMAVLDSVKSAFAAAPVTNPDGINGIKLHNDVGQAPYNGGNAVPESNFITQDPACAVNTDLIWADFDPIKARNFSPARLDIFHYTIWGHDICPALAGVSGIARGIPSSDFLVTLGSWPSFGTENVRTGTFMHELGHNLGLTHGGNTGDHENYKPNHLSVMNYSFQTIGVWRSSARRWDYTRLAINALTETNLNETTGLDGPSSLAAYGTRWYCGTAAHDDNTADTNVDWNCNGSYQASVSRDINKNGGKTVLGAVHNQWINTIYNGGSIGAGVPKYLVTPLDASTFVEYPCLRYRPR